MNFRVLSVAIAAARFYEDRRPDLAEEFFSQMQQAFASIRSNYLGLPLLEYYSGSHSVGRCLMDGFPYAVIYVCRPDEIVVVAVAHTRRRPLYWLDRLC